MDKVVGDDHFPPVALDDVACVSHRIAIAGPGLDAGEDFPAAVERLRFSDGDVRAVLRHRTLHEFRKKLLGSAKALCCVA